MPKSTVPKSSKSPGDSKKASTSQATTMADLLASTGYNIPTLKRGQELSGRVIAVTHQEVLIDVGAKSEGIVFGRELASVRDVVSKLSVGDSVDALVLYPENDAGQVVLSLRKHSGEKRWTELEARRQNGEDIEVVALEANRGGIICDWMGIHGFLPASQLTKTPTKLSDLIGKNLSCRVIEVDRNTNRLIISQKQPDKRDIKELLELLSKIQIGEKYSGNVTAVLPFGIFVEIEAKKESKVKKASANSGSSTTSDPSKIEGLVHISEISWEKIEDPAKMFKVGDKVEVMVIAKDETNGRLNLSIRQLLDDPFMAVSGKYSKDQNVSGTISRITSYGDFVSLEGGIEGFVHVSKIPTSESWEVGKSVEFIVDSIDTKARRISLVPVAKEKPVLYR